MDTKNRWIIYKLIYKTMYLSGLILLLSGMLLSLVSSPAEASSLRTVKQTATAKPQQHREPVGSRSNPQRSAGKDNGALLPGQAAGRILAVQTQLAPGTGSVRFLTPTTDICMLGPGTVSADVEVSLPAGVSAILQTSYRIAEPPDLRTATVYESYDVQNGDVVTVSGAWPGVRAGDQVVEVHFGALLLDPASRGPISDGAGMDYYWYPWTCGVVSPPPPTAVQGETAVVTETLTATQTETPTATLTELPPTVVAGETETPTSTATNVSTAVEATEINQTETSTATATITSTATATITEQPPTVQASTATPTVTQTATQTEVPELPTLSPTPTVTRTATTQVQTVVVSLTPTSTPTNTSVPPTVGAGETAINTPPPTLTPENATAVSPTEEQLPSPIVIIVTATSEIPVTGEGGTSYPTVAPGGQQVTLQAPAQTEQSLAPVTGADLAHRSLATTSVEFWQKLSTYLGLLLLGAGLVMQGLSRRI